MGTVPLFGQKYNRSCWAASIRMILASKGQWIDDDDMIARECDRLFKLTSGLQPDDRAPFTRWGFAVEPPKSYSEEGFRGLVRTKGPIWIACDVRTPGYSQSFPHVRVVVGMESLDSPLRLLVNDPWPVGRGAQYVESYEDMMAKNNLLGATEADKSNPVYVAYYAGK